MQKESEAVLLLLLLLAATKGNDQREVKDTDNAKQDYAERGYS